MDREFSHFVLHFLSYADAKFKSREIGENVAHYMEERIEALIYNVASLASTMALVYNSKKVEPKHVTAIHDKYKSLCSSTGGAPMQTGGTSMPQQFFSPNASSTMSASNFGGMDSRTIDFAANEARAGIDVAGPDASFIGGAAGPGTLTATAFRNENGKQIAKFARSVLKLHNMSVSKHAMHDIQHIIFYHLDCLTADLRKKSYINVPIVQKMLKLKRHSIFH